MPLIPRSAGVLLHPTSLPGPHGIGDLGPEAYRWIETLAAMKQSWWQILPLGPTGAGNSPYQAYSAFAGNIALLSPDLLADDDLADRDAISQHLLPADRVDFDRVLPLKRTMLRDAWSRFGRGRGPGELRREFDSYCEREAAWLHEYALFVAIHEALGGTGMASWPAEVRKREPKAVAAIEEKVAGEVKMHQFGQFLFDRQWGALRRFAREKKIKLIGDAPIFVSGDSSDVWAHPDQFLLDADGKPTVVAGVPPDYFSPTGQHWGNPLYNWDRMAETGFSWWVARLRRELAHVDLVRLDHFRGFAAAWHIPASESTAMNGKWVDGPRAKLFEALKANLGALPIIAEDLGVITPDVDELRLAFELPGMRVLEFALGGPTNQYWPHNYVPNTVAYTGTHDNETAAGWYAGLNDTDKRTLAEYFGRPLERPAWELIRAAWASVAVLAVAPMQDLLELGNAARMNTPGTPTGNWGWRMQPNQFKSDIVDRMASFTAIYNRLPAEPK